MSTNLLWLKIVRMRPRLMENPLPIDASVFHVNVTINAKTAIASPTSRHRFSSPLMFARTTPFVRLATTQSSSTTLMRTRTFSPCGAKTFARGLYAIGPQTALRDTYAHIRHMKLSQYVTTTLISANAISPLKS